MSIDEALVKSLRRDEAWRFNTTGTIHRETGQTLSTSTGTYTVTTASVYSGPCLLMPYEALHDTPNYGQEDVNTRLYAVKITENVDVLPDDIFTVTGGGLDDDLIGAAMTVVDVRYASRQVVRSLIVQHNRGG